jgi:hypothetical protein
MWLLKWANANRLTAAIIVVLLLVATASALDGYRNRKEIRRLNVAIGVQEKAALDAKEKELKEAEEGWLRSLNASDAKLAPVLRERNDLRAKLAARDKTPFEVPATDKDTVARWKALGYAVRMGPCK